MPNFQTKAQSEPAKPEVYNFHSLEGETKILGFSGKLGSGKTSCANYLHSLAFMYSLGLTEEAFVSEDGKLIVADSDRNLHEAKLDSKDPAVVDYLASQVWPFIKKYSFADPLKSIANIVLGIDNNLLYGSQEDKNTLTQLKWEEMPTKVVKKFKKGEQSTVDDSSRGLMSVRDVLEYVGSEIFRKMSPNCWADALIRTIQKDLPNFAIIDDIRFSNEVFSIQQAGGKVIRLDLVTEESAANTHTSNTALDDFHTFDGWIHNKDMTMSESFAELIALLMKWEYFKVVS